MCSKAVNVQFDFGISYHPVACGNGQVDFLISSPYNYGHLTVASADGSHVLRTLDLTPNPSSYTTGPLGFEPRTAVLELFWQHLNTTTIQRYIVCLNGNQCCGVSCDDGNYCTNDSCDAISGCHHVNNTNPCADDGNPCTQDRCNAGQCYRTGPMNGTPCNDGNACTSGDQCQSGSCVGTTANCDDANACTADGCDVAGGCIHTAVSCDDGNTCTQDSCDPSTGCQHTAVSCDDGNGCTTDLCDPAAGCSHPFAAKCLTPVLSSLDPQCGDGHVDDGEQCDDGNTRNGDCCSSSCQFEPAGTTCGGCGKTCNGAGLCR
jgi:cysteine-rich repeat protein